MYHFTYGSLVGASLKQHVQIIVPCIAIGITKGNMRVLHDMMGKLPTVEVPLTKSSLQYTQRGSNPVPIPGSHQASVCVGNPVEILMFSATQTLSVGCIHHAGLYWLCIVD